MTHIDYFPVLTSLLAGELARMRKCAGVARALTGISRSTELGSGGFGADERELPDLAAAVGEMFQLDGTGFEKDLVRRRTLGDWAEIISASLHGRAGHLSFRTSGSSGKPKACTHLVADLEQEIETHAASNAGCERVLTMVPTHHIYGFLWTAMLPPCLGAEVLDVRGWDVSRLAGEIRAKDLLVGTPAQWRRLGKALERFPRSVKGVTSGEPCPAQLFRKLNEQGLHLTEVYGSSETGGVGTRESASVPLALLPFWKRGASSTSLVRIYGRVARKPFEVESPDYLEWHDERHFFVTGRRDGAVQVGGVNVFPELVAECIRGHPAVLDCAVRLMRPDEGERLKAFVVLRRGSSLDQRSKELESWLQNRLSPHERPARVSFGLELPRNALGKVSDWDC